MACNLSSLADERSIVVRYEDLLHDPAEVVEGIAGHFTLTRRTRTFQQVTRRTRNLGTGRRDRVADAYTLDQPFDPGPYRRGDHLAAFTRRQRRLVDRQVDDTLAAGLGDGSGSPARRNG